MEYKLTEYSHGAGCGCKISPSVLSEILQGIESADNERNILVGNSFRDDAAVVDAGNGNCIISTTDFFMPIVDDPYDFGRIAAANAISDVYAMGGTPVVAISIFGWPIEKLPPEVGREVIRGGRDICAEAGIALAGGHSIDSPEPIFGLAVTGTVKRENLKTNSGAQPGDSLFLTKPLGIGILSTAQKKKLLEDDHKNIARNWMVKLNNIGEKLSALSYVNAITDVTGFGLLGHMHELCLSSGLMGIINRNDVPVIEEAIYYADKNCIPGGNGRNWKSYGDRIEGASEQDIRLFADPQTSGGLLVSANTQYEESLKRIFEENSTFYRKIGRVEEGVPGGITIV